MFDLCSPAGVGWAGPGGGNSAGQIATEGIPVIIGTSYNSLVMTGPKTGCQESELENHIWRSNVPSGLVGLEIEFNGQGIVKEEPKESEFETREGGKYG